MPSTEVINLGDAFGTDSETRAFAERYLRVQHTDLLFADAAILVEGTAERMLVPLFIERYFKELGERYISFLDIGGSHAHRLRPFIERLGIPTVIITDIDPVRLEKDAKGRPVYKAAHNNGHDDLVCGNDTLTSWHPKLAALADMANPSEDHLVWKGASGLKVRFAWQVPVASAGDAWPSAFEDSFILTNIAWFKELGTSPPATSKSTKAVRGVLGKVVNTVADYPDHAELASKLHDLIHRSFDKGEFAAAVFEHMSARPDIACPEYIFNALKWLQKELDPSTKGSM
jgi:predicted ATP-dependent endonuclease of OLD family